MENDRGAMKSTVMSQQCLPELRQVFADFQTANDALHADPNQSDAQVKVCLLSRTAFTDFYSVSVLDNQIDKPTSTTLSQLFDQALSILPEGKYRESVQDRFTDFVAFCDEISARSELDTDVGVFDLT